MVAVDGDELTPPDEVALATARADLLVAYRPGKALKKVEDALVRLQHLGEI